MLVARQELHPACKKLGVGLSVVTIWLELCTSYDFSCCHQLRYLCCNKIPTGNILVPANPGPPGKWLLKWRERLNWSPNNRSPTGLQKIFGEH